MIKKLATKEEEITQKIASMLLQQRSPNAKSTFRKRLAIRLSTDGFCNG